MARPVIGIPCYAGKRAGTLRPLYGNNSAYSKAVEMAGGTPVLIPHFDDLAHLEPLCSRLDGLLLPGGLDMHPQAYGEAPHALLGSVDLNEDRLDQALADYFLEMDLPILGVCRGMQVLNVVARGTLYQDLHAQRPESIKHAYTGKPRAYRAHSITFTPGTRMAEIMGSEPMMVNSFHHQGVKTLARNASVSATAPDGLIEGMEFPNHRFVLAIQCHPEELTVAGDERALRLFQGFVQAATRPAKASYRVAS